ncbi:Protein of unknown function [Propionibacterium freudenreichii]|uniref:hypothetical protein n=1 Tax=Propionibacterium freudenreichii TaxID=1744 RepID=UPI0005A5CE0C|nr:hypothetical protein [Propionibacterium freudenreichii]CEI26477.1 Protein of unknown function [Propionibacterium freudenreichii]
MRGRVVVCNKCGRRYRAGSSDAMRWSVQLAHGRIMAVYCPACQTAVGDNTTMAMLRYHLDERGRIVANTHTGRVGA